MVSLHAVGEVATRKEMQISAVGSRQRFILQGKTPLDQWSGRDSNSYTSKQAFIVYLTFWLAFQITTEV